MSRPTFKKKKKKKKKKKNFNSVAYLTNRNIKSNLNQSQRKETNGNPLQYFCLENPMDGGAWQAIVHGVPKSWTQLSDFTFFLSFTFCHLLCDTGASHSNNPSLTSLIRRQQYPFSLASQFSGKESGLQVAKQDFMVLLGSIMGLK